MSATRKSAAICLTLFALAAWASTKLYVMESLMPRTSKNPPAGYTAEGSAWHYQDGRVDVRVALLTAEQRAAFYTERGLQDPFASSKPIDNLLVFRVRFQNLTTDKQVEFSPTAAMLGNSMAYEDTRIYQLVYREANPEEKLAAVGKTLYLSHLSLPAGEWIERLMIFTYDDPYPTKNISLILGGVMAGGEGVDLQFPFKATYRKEKIE